MEVVVLISQMEVRSLQVHFTGEKNRVSKSRLDRGRVGPVTLLPDPGELGVSRLGWGWDRAPLSRWWGGG